MRKILASLLMITMFASAVLCGCEHEARAESGIASHSHHDDAADSDHHHDGKGGKVSQDCQKADVQLPAHIGVAKPDLSNNLHPDLAAAVEPIVWPLTLASARGIRGPPPWDDGASHTKLPVFLTTQRLRI